MLLALHIATICSATLSFDKVHFKPVPSPRGGFWGRSSPNKAPIPPTWNLKHDKSVEFLSVFRVSGPPAQTQRSPAETQSPPIENFLATVLFQKRTATSSFAWFTRDNRCVSTNTGRSQGALSIWHRHNSRHAGKVILRFMETRWKALALSRRNLMRWITPNSMNN